MQTMSSTVTAFPKDKSNALQVWLEAVNTHLAVRKSETRSDRTQRNRARQKARHEARRLFAEHDRRIALAQARLAA